MVDSITGGSSQWNCPDVHVEGGDGGAKEHPATDLSLLQKETSKRTSHLRYTISLESTSRLHHRDMGWYSPRLSYLILVMDRFDGVEPVLDGERALI